MSLRYKPHVHRVFVDPDDLPGVIAWDIDTNPYWPHGGLRRPTLRKAMQVCEALYDGVAEEDLTVTFEGMCGLLDLLLMEVEDGN